MIRHKKIKMIEPLNKIKSRRKIRLISKKNYSKKEQEDWALKYNISIEEYLLVESLVAQNGKD